MSNKPVPTPKQFAAMAYLVLMDHHGQGFKHAHPDYVEEKLRMLNMGYDAVGLLDSQNQCKLIAYLAEWGYDVPQEWADRYKDQ